MSDLKHQIKEIVEIVALVPEEFKTTCFEILLKEAVANNKPSAVSEAAKSAFDASVPPVTNSPAKVEETVDEPDTALRSAQPKVDEGTDIATADVHIKVRRFLEKSDLTIANLNELFYKENDGFQSLITDLGATKVSEAQMRISLLQALHNALDSGEFVTTVEKVREECKMRKSYDSNNFGANFRNNALLFDFGTWTKDVTELKLSEPGKKDLVTIIKALS